MKNQKGQALIIIIFAIALATSILSSAVIAAVSLGKNSLESKNALTASYSAESGLEAALLKLTRDQTSCNGSESLNVNGVNVTINYSFSSPACTIVATAQIDTVLKKFQAQATIANQKVTYCCWKASP